MMYSSVVPVQAARSKLMSKIRRKNTKPEMAVRRQAFALGYRFRLHQKGLPGKPDIVFVKRRKVIFVHGCFWHCHVGCSKASIPKTHKEFWQSKLGRNVERDARNEAELRNAGWDVLVIWECKTRNPESLAEALQTFLGPTNAKCT